jgi:hypothetical protein
VTASGTRLVIRGEASESNGLDQEAWFLARARQAGVPVPEVVWLGPWKPRQAQGRWWYRRRWPSGEDRLVLSRLTSPPPIRRWAVGQSHCQEGAP